MLKVRTTVVLRSHTSGELEKFLLVIQEVELLFVHRR